MRVWIMTLMMLMMSGCNVEEQQPVVTIEDAVTTHVESKPSVSSVTFDDVQITSGINENAVIKITFNQDIDASTVNSSIILSQDGTLLTPSIGVAGKVITLTPSANMIIVNASYTLTVKSTVKNTSGVAMAADYSLSFTTVTNSIPKPITPDFNGSVDVGIDKNFTITFSEAMDTTTLSSASITLSNGTDTIATTISSDATSVTIVPQAYLTPSQSYTITLATSITDIDGIPLAQSYTYSFTTNGQSVTTYTQTTPTHLAQDTNYVAVDSAFIVEYASVIEIANVNDIKLLDANSAIVNATIAVDTNDTSRLRITPTADLNVSSMYRVTVEPYALRDHATRILIPTRVDQNFTVSSHKRPYESLQTSTDLRPDDALIVYFGTQLAADAASKTVVNCVSPCEHSVLPVNNNTGLEVKPNTTWTEGALNITFESNISNVDGVPMGHDFVIAGRVTMPPKVTSTYPEANATGLQTADPSNVAKIRVNFDRNISSTATGCVTLSDSSSTVALTVAVSLQSLVIDWPSLSTGTHYTLTVLGDCVKESSDRVAMKEAYSFSFTTINVEEIHGVFQHGATSLFGTSLALSGDGIKGIIGAPKSNNDNTDQGRAYYWEHTALGTGNWTYHMIEGNTGKYDNLGTGLFGTSVAISRDGNLSIAGAPQWDHNFTTENYGYVSRIGWPTSETMIEGDTNSGYFGDALSMSDDGSTYAIIASGNFVVGGTTYDGRLSIYYPDANNSGNSLIYYAYGGAVNSTDELWSVTAVSGNGQTVAVQRACGGDGCVHTYDRNASATWDERSRIMPSSGSGFGDAISLSQDGLTMAVGFSGAVPSHTTNATGVVEIYTRLSIGSDWEKTATVVPTTLVMPGAQFGKSVALSRDGSTLLIGSPNLYATAGTVFYYQKVGTIWQFKAKYYELTPDQTQGYFGNKVAISDDGKTYLIGCNPDKSKVYYYRH